MSKRLFVISLIAVFSINSRAQVAATIDFGQVKQIIDGFGVSTAWHGTISEAEADIAFGNSKTEQLGLTILRVRIDPSPSAWVTEKMNAAKAKNRGALVLATPWTPPAYMKTNNNAVGGELLPTQYAAYAQHLKDFCKYLGNVDVVSLQNEPNITVGYESCTWSAAQMLEFCKTNAPAIGKPVMAPEAYNFAYSTSDPILNDPIACANIQYIGGHLYGTTTRSYPLAVTKGKKLWMTEFAYNPDSIGTCMTMAKDILDCLNGNMNAFVYWYLRQPGCNIINTDGTLKLKGYTLEQFSKFIRPGYYRVSATYQPNSKIYLVAFKGSTQDVLVAVNQNTVAKTQVYNFRNMNIMSASKFVTSDTKRLSNTETITATNNSFTDNLDARSISTYILQRAPSAIGETAIADINIFPNPAEDFIQLSTTDNVKSVNIFNLQGQKIMIFNNLVNPTLDISSLQCGTYIIQVSLFNRAEKRMKFFKK